MKSNKVLAFLLAFVALFAITVPTTVRADDGDEPVYEKLYFISDSSEYWGLKLNAVLNIGSACGLDYDKIETMDISNSDNPFWIFYGNTPYIDNNSVVVVELLTRIKNESSTLYPSPIESLYLAFSSLKEKNCKVMFISGNDEDTLQGYTSFLNYVDVHINLDFKYALVKGIVSTVEKNAGDGIGGNFYFILDNIFSKPSNTDNDFVWRWLLPYYKEVYADEHAQYNTDHPDEPLSIEDYLIEEKNIRFYGQVDMWDTVMYDYWTGASVRLNVNSVNDPFLSADKVYMIGVKNQNKVASKWCTMVRKLKSTFLPDSVFTAMLTTQSCDPLEIGEYESVGATGLMFYDIIDTVEGIYTIYDILADFMSGANMQKYNNVGGVCEITYMPIIISDDGWFPIHLVMDCFQVFD